MICVWSLYILKLCPPIFNSTEILNSCSANLKLIFLFGLINKWEDFFHANKVTDYQYNLQFHVVILLYIKIYLIT